MTSSSDALNIGALREEYAATLKQYNDAYNMYMSQLNDKNNKYTIIDNRAWWGSSAISEGSASSSDECKLMCEENDDCNGATFNKESKYCWIRGGEGSISVNNDTSAIILTNTNNLKILNALNDKLLQLNKQIADTIQYNASEYESQKQEQEEVQNILQSDKEQLTKEKRLLIKELQEYVDLSENNENQSLYAARQNWLLLLLTILAVLLVGIAIFLFGKVNIKTYLSPTTTPFTTTGTE